MTQTEWINAHIDYLVKSTLPDKVKVKAVSGIRRLHFDHLYRSVTGFEYRFVNIARPWYDFKEIGLLMWSSSSEGTDFWCRVWRHLDRETWQS